MRVLVVEASTEDRRAIVDALMPLDEIAVQGAVADVQSAMRAIVEESPDIVVTGVELPDGSGLDLIEKALLTARPPRIVVVAEAPTRDDWQRHLAAGADRFVERDGELDELRSVMGTLARPRRDVTTDDTVRLLGRIAAGVTHDLNNYLGALGVTLALLDREPGSPELIAQARDCAERMARLTTTMLQYARGETPPLVPVDMVEIVRGVLRVIDRIVPPNVQIEAELSELSRPVLGAVAEIEQLVLNLVINALDAMPEGGVIRIRVQPTGSSATFLEISDDGRGIDTPRSSRRPGLGLGIVRRVVARHGGAVKVVPGNDGGTVATVFLPTA